MNSLFLTCLALGTSAADRPHVIILMADDMGYECLSPEGFGDSSRPDFDRPATEGVRFTNARPASSARRRVFSS